MRTRRKHAFAPRWRTEGSRARLAAGLLFGALGCAESREPLIIAAAASLTDAFMELESEFERIHSNVDVQLSFSGSQVARVQIAQGAPYHLFASAHADHIRDLKRRGKVSEVHVLAANELVVVLPADSPFGIDRFSRLTEVHRIVLGGEEVPVGRYARQVLERAERAEGYGTGFVQAVMKKVVSFEPNVRRVRALVELGEADAGFVYASDVKPGLKAIRIPPALNVRARYLLAVLGEIPARAPARSFVQFASSVAGQAILRRHGFFSASSAAAP